jgi:hypothetical protein
VKLKTGSNLWILIGRTGSGSVYGFDFRSADSDAVIIQ